jgi:hypothetical protein
LDAPVRFAGLVEAALFLAMLAPWSFISCLLFALVPWTEAQP